MKRHKRKHTGEFKAKVALEAIRGIKKTNRLPANRLARFHDSVGIL